MLGVVPLEPIPELMDELAALDARKPQFRTPPQPLRERLATSARLARLQASIQAKEQRSSQ